MTSDSLILAQITLATTDTPAMIRFYNTLFAIDLRPVEAYGTTLYRTRLHNVRFVLCPNSLAGVQAEQSRHQFSYTVTDLKATIDRAIGAGGVLQGEMQPDDQLTDVAIRDPDGNSLVFFQAED